MRALLVSLCIFLPILQGGESQALPAPADSSPSEPTTAPLATLIQPALTLFSPRGPGVLAPSSFLGIPKACVKTSRTESPTQSLV